MLVHRPTMGRSVRSLINLKDQKLSVNWTHVEHKIARFAAGRWQGGRRSYGCGYHRNLCALCLRETAQRYSGRERCIVIFIFDDCGRQCAARKRGVRCGPKDSRDWGKRHTLVVVLLAGDFNVGGRSHGRRRRMKCRCRRHGYVVCDGCTNSENCGLRGAQNTSVVFCRCD